MWGYPGSSGGPSMQSRASLREGGRALTHTQGAGGVQMEQTDMKTPAFKIKVIVIQPQAKERWQPPEQGWGGGGEQILPRASEGHSATDTLPSTTSRGVHSTSRDRGQLPPFPTPISFPQNHLSENLLALGCNVPPQSASLPPTPLRG